MRVQRIGRYNIVCEIGRGSIGAVYEARDTQNNITAAIKMLYVDQTFSGVHKRQALERFRREAKAAGSLVHPNIAQVYDLGEEDGRHYLTMEFCSRGINFSELLYSICSFTTAI